MKDACKAFLYGLWMICAACGIVLLALVTYAAFASIHQCDSSWGSVGLFIGGVLSFVLWAFTTGCFGNILLDNEYYQKRIDELREEHNNHDEV